MRKNKYTCPFLIVILLVSIIVSSISCTFINNTLTYQEKSKHLIEYVLSENYEAAIDCFALNRINNNETTINNVKNGLIPFHDVLVKNFGTHLKYKLISSKKTWSTKSDQNTPKDCTIVQVQFSNRNDFGIFEVLFDDISGKIVNIKTLDIKNKIPNMAFFWLIGILALVFPVFNIYMIVQVRKNYINNKNKLKYLSIILINFPSITYSAVKGFSIHLLTIQFLFGFGFSYMGFIGSTWTIGIPLAGIYWFIKIYLLKKQSLCTNETIINDLKNQDASNN